MISRRDFIKSFSLAAIGLAAGISTKNLLSLSPESMYIYGFIPVDENVLQNLSLYIRHLTGSRDLYLQGNYNNIFSRQFHLTKESNLIIKIKSIQHEVYSDIMKGDALKTIYSLEGFDLTLLKIRESIAGRKAGLFFSAEQHSSSLLDIFNNRKKIIIENHSGIYDEIDINKSYSLINIPGLHGMTSLQVRDGSVKIVKASCRHKLCMNMNENLLYGGTAACVPNKILIRTTTA